MAIIACDSEAIDAGLQTNAVVSSNNPLIGTWDVTKTSGGWTPGDNFLPGEYIYRFINDSIVNVELNRVIPLNNAIAFASFVNTGNQKYRIEKVYDVNFSTDSLNMITTTAWVDTQHAYEIGAISYNINTTPNDTTLFIDTNLKVLFDNVSGGADGNTITLKKR